MKSVLGMDIKEETKYQKWVSKQLFQNEKEMDSLATKSRALFIDLFA